MSTDATTGYLPRICYMCKARITGAWIGISGESFCSVACLESRNKPVPCAECERLRAELAEARKGAEKDKSVRVNYQSIVYEICRLAEDRPLSVGVDDVVGKVKEKIAARPSQPQEGAVPKPETMNSPKPPVTLKSLSQPQQPQQGDTVRVPRHDARVLRSMKDAIPALWSDQQLEAFKALESALDAKGAHDESD